MRASLVSGCWMEQCPTRISASVLVETLDYSLRLGLNLPMHVNVRLRLEVGSRFINYCLTFILLFLYLLDNLKIRFVSVITNHGE